MVTECKVSVEGVMYGIKISKKEVDCLIKSLQNLKRQFVQIVGSLHYMLTNMNHLESK